MPRSRWFPPESLTVQPPTHDLVSPLAVVEPPTVQLVPVFAPATATAMALLAPIGVPEGSDVPGDPPLAATMNGPCVLGSMTVRLMDMVDTSATRSLSHPSDAKRRQDHRSMRVAILVTVQRRHVCHPQHIFQTTGGSSVIVGQKYENAQVI